MGKPKKSRTYSSFSEDSSEENYKRKKNKKKNRKRNYSTSSSEEKISRKHKKHHKKRSSSSSSDSDRSSEWVEAENCRKRLPSPQLESNQKLERESWMNVKSNFATTSNSDRKRERDEQKRIEREKQQYDPRKCDRELNPYWKHGGDGLPTFKKPVDTEKEYNDYKSSNNRYTARTSNWRKKPEKSDEPSKHKTSKINNIDKKEEASSSKEDTSEVIYTEKDLNILAAKLVKAEIMGNSKAIKELKEKLETAREHVANSKPSDDYILTQTDSKGQSKPLKLESEHESYRGKSKSKKIETHQGKERVRYFADDDKYSLKQMFENEKYNTADNQDKEFIKSFGKIRKNDDLDDIFSDNIRKKESEGKVDERNKNKAISDHQKISQTLDNCNKCIQSESTPKHLMISMGETVYLSLPAYEPLTEGHCMIVPIKHTPCATQLDENEWSDVMDVRKSLVRLFNASNKTCVFFECAMRLHKFPHMVIECIPIDREEGDMAPIYFKKAIDESEIEWAQNKKLIHLKGKDVRKAVPKGLAYFSVSFGMEEGFAHVIEDEQLFPNNFAQEIIGGMLDLHHSKWRKPKVQKFEEQKKRVLEFSSSWKDFDCLTNY
ncbi:unnamed protein product [Phyllotreta striolata]|uniref:CWF19-like protein 2 n=1 Tax=Phyllotreta striolata TaxID=444603 RepID=A0A9N9TFG6_PHYSR|nr:unnamed protein product [Phyllotreta striolata]